MIENDDRYIDLEETAYEDEQQEMFEHYRFDIAAGQVPMRVDKYLATHMEYTSRHRIQLAGDLCHPYLSLLEQQLTLAAVAAYIAQVEQAAQRAQLILAVRVTHRLRHLRGGLAQRCTAHE